MVSETRSTNPYLLIREHYRGFSSEQLKTMAHIKRFFECAWGDPAFRRFLEGDTAPPSTLQRELRTRGCQLDPLALHDLIPLACRDVNDDSEVDMTALEGHPLGQLWIEYNAPKLKNKANLRPHAETPTLQPAFHAWRQRQINRCRSELGERSDMLPHNVIAFELSAGCSVGCPFCALDAPDLQAVWRHTPQNAQRWQDVLTWSVATFGHAAQTGVCYWATEPLDNPDYVDFARTFRAVTGELPQVTTARPLKDVALTRELLQLHTEDLVPLRFSVLNRKMLHDIHQTFSPEELLAVNLLMYCNPKRTGFCRSGRLLNDDNPICKSGKYRLIRNTASCVTGLLINMPLQTVKLITPCCPDHDNPYGYKLTGSGTFSDTDDLSRFFRNVIATHMTPGLPSESCIAFRRDLTFADSDTGFELKSHYRRHTMGGGPGIRALGRLIAKGQYTADELLREVLRSGGDYLAAMGALTKLYDGGLIETSRQPVQAGVS
jgi:radical SAM family RiPP maturation amino acid epimerase